VLSLTVEAAPQKKRNMIYSQSYDYPFKKDLNVVNCVARASATLAKHGLGHGIGTSINEGEQWGMAFGWSEDSTETAEISCNRTHKISILSYAIYSARDNKQIWNKWETLKDSSW